MKKAVIIGSNNGISKGLAHFLSANKYELGVIGYYPESQVNLDDTFNNNIIIKPLSSIISVNATKYLDELFWEMNGIDLLIYIFQSFQTKLIIHDLLDNKICPSTDYSLKIIAEWALKLFENQKSGHLVVIFCDDNYKTEANQYTITTNQISPRNYIEKIQDRARRSEHPITVTYIQSELVNNQDETQFISNNSTKNDNAVRQVYRAVVRKWEAMHKIRISA
jgi:hypothetical protein